jgi:hypothetical protein
MTRQPYRAGSFYEAEPKACRRSATAMVNAAALPEDLPEVLYGGLVPHAGWVFSGRTAAATLKALARRGRLERVVLFGADHWGLADGAAVYDKGAWGTPLGEVPIDEEMAQVLLKSCSLLDARPNAHGREHSLEVQLPLMQVLSPQVRIVPVNVSPSDQAAQVGRQIGEALREHFPQASVVGSTDLTHYGPQYGFTPGGVGPGGVQWAKENDQRLLKLIQSMQADQIVGETSARQNACGGGAIAAALAACAALGATRGLCLEYTTSADVMEKVYRAASDDAVGYAAVVFA